MKLSRIAARLGVAALTVTTITSASLLAVVQPAAALTANHFELSLSGVDLSTRLFIAGSPHNLTITAKNADGSTDSLYTGAVNIAVVPADPTSTIPSTYTFTPTDAGTHTFTGVTLKQLSTYGSNGHPNSVFIGVTDATIQTSFMTPSGVNVAPQLEVTGVPSPLPVGSTVNALTVTAKDFSGTVTPGYRGVVQFTSTDPSAVLPADYGFTAGDAGRHVFSATLKTAGLHSITATEPETATTGSQGNINVAPRLAVTGLASNVGAGVPQTVTVTAQNADAGPTTFTGYRGTVHFTPSGSDVYPSDYTFTAADNGTHTFTNGSVLKAIGARTITVTDTATNLTSGSQSTTVVPVLGVAMASAVTAGKPADVTVTAKDGTGATVSSYRGTVQFTTSDASHVLPTDYTFLAGDNGVHTFTGGVTLNSVGVQSVTVTEPAQPLTTGTQSGVAVDAGLRVSGVTDPIDLNTPSSVTVTAIDGNGNVQNGYTGQIHFTSSDPNATVPADYTFLTGDNGSHTFSGVSFQTAGDQTLTATDTVKATITGLQAGITVVPHLSVTQVPVPSFRTVPESFVVTARNGDTGNTVATGYRGTVHISTSDSNDSVPADYTFTAGDNGVHTFFNGLAFAAAGANHSVSARDAASLASLGSQAGINVVDPVVSLTTTGSDTAGNDHTVTATVNDGSGHNVPDGTPVQFVLTEPLPDRFTDGATYVAAASTPSGRGAWLAGDDGTVRALGDAGDFGDAIGALSSDESVVAIAATPTGDGFWLATDAGRILPFGGAGFFGDESGLPLTSPVTGFSSSHDGLGYTLVLENGAVLTHGDAGFFGSVANATRPIAGIAQSPAGAGYYIWDDAGRVTNFGDAVAFGDLHNTVLNHPITGLAVTAAGYRLLGSDGSVFSFGDAAFYGSDGSGLQDAPASAVVSQAGGGYLLLRDNGRLLAFNATATPPLASTVTATTTNGQAQTTVTSLVAGASTVLARAGSVASTASAVAWSAGSVDLVVLSDATPDRLAKQSRTMVAYVSDAYGNAVANGTSLTWAATGTGGESPDHGSTTVTNGVASFAFGSSKTGTSHVTATSGGVSDLADVSWIGGYWIFSGDGGVKNVGNAGFFGSLAGKRLNGRIIGAAGTPSGNGYWLVGSDGGIFTFGDARFFGSTGSARLNAPVIGMASTPSGNGYWLVAADGGIFSFGDAKFFGSTGSLRLNSPVFAMTPTTTGRGYWLVARDGGIFTFGDAKFYGSAGGYHLNKPVVGAAVAPSGNGYWLVGSDGGIFSFGDARFFGSAGGFRLNAPVVAMAPTITGAGYWLLASDGGLFTFGDAPFIDRGLASSVAIVAADR